MNNNSYWSRSNLLKGTGTLCVLIIFGYYAYQDVMNRNMLERSLNENAAHYNVTLAINLLNYDVLYMEIRVTRMWLEKLRMQNLGT